MRLIAFSTALLLLSGCTASYYYYPSEYERFYLNGKRAKPDTRFAEKVKQDMRSCGFSNTHDNVGYMTHNEWVLADFCMEEKGYKPGYIGGKMANTICDFEFYQQTETCRNRKPN